MNVGTAILRSARAETRLDRARAWLLARPPAEEVLIVAATRDAANELLRSCALERGASFGWQRVTLRRLASALATQALADRGWAPIGALAEQALVARVVHALAQSRQLGRYASAASGPGLSRALARALSELRLAGLDAAGIEGTAPELEALLQRVEEELASAGLADTATVLAIATERARDLENSHPLLGLPTLLLDLAIESRAEAAVVEALAARAPALLATLPDGDPASASYLSTALACEAEELELRDGSSSLARLQAHLFEDSAPRAGDLGQDVIVLSAPGESRECVEIARHLRRFAAQGIAFDRMAVLLRSPEEYRPHLEEAFGRAGIPAHFVRGAVRPDPTGRAFLALLACASEGLSARRFAEYLSLGQVPDADQAGAPPAAPPTQERWVPADDEVVPAAIAAAVAESLASSSEEFSEDPDLAPVTGGTLRAPRRWEQLLVDAAVIGGRDRWERRLDGADRQLRLDLDALEDDDPKADRLRRDLDDLASLRAYALPLVAELDALPERATWGEWLDLLSALAARSLRHPERVLSVLAELGPMAPVGPVGLQEVQLVLTQRLRQVHLPPSDRRYGRVYVAPVEAVRGLAFDVVFVPGLAEKLFPRKIAEEPILLDDARERLGQGLDTRAGRLARERLALRLAVGAARRAIVLSYPRLDLDQARPRVPSFYTLEALRAAEGRLPGFDELAARAETLAELRVGWPAPSDPADAIDEAEHDLALLEGLLRMDPERSIGTARFLLTANAHLGRALRFRARRWLRRWTSADGLVEPSESAREAIAAHTLPARSYSPTALQHYALCPYRFFLQAVHRLTPREVPEAIEELEPLQRGSLVHEVQFELFERLRDRGLLPLEPSDLSRALALLDQVLDQVADRARDELAPAIERVWEDAIESIRADLREWLRRLAEDRSGFVPWRFELAFGLPGRRAADPHSAKEAVELASGMRLRGSIDLVERGPGGVLRATDHKTGKVRFREEGVIAGGEVLQPVFYALALEALFPDSPVGAGRLYYCTADGGFTEHTVPLDERARRSAQAVADTVRRALSEPFLPAAPAHRACEWCDYRVVCGPYEELRTARKPPDALAPLERLRALP